MALLVNRLVKSARKLLHRVDQDLLPLTIHLEALSKRVCLSLNQPLASQYHETLDFMSVDIYLTCRLVIRL